MSNRPVWLPDTQGFLAIAIIFLMVLIIGVLLLHPPTLDDRTSAVLTTIIGVLLANLKEVYGYFFGSSKGSDQKDNALISGAVAPTNVQQTVVPPTQGPKP